MTLRLALTAAWRSVLTTANPDKYPDLWASGDWFDAVVQPFLDLLGPIFPLVVGLAVAGMLFVWSGGMGLPIVVMILIGGLLIPVMPPEAQGVAGGLLLLGIALALYRAWVGGGSRL